MISIHSCAGRSLVSSRGFEFGDHVFPDRLGAFPQIHSRIISNLHDALQEVSALNHDSLAELAELDDVDRAIIWCHCCGRLAIGV